MIVGITGASGFVGRHLASAYKKINTEVRLLSRSPPNSNDKSWFQGDLANNTGNIEKFLDGLDVLYHCAGELENETLMYQLHVNGTKNLANMASGKIKRWVQLSSVGVYGPQRSGVIRESEPSNPLGTYEVTKEESDRLLIEIAEREGMDYVILRPSNIFASDMKSRYLYQLIDTVRRGIFFYIGAPGAISNYIHVSSVVSALMLCGEHKMARNRIFIISDSIKLEDMINKISQAVGVKPPGLRIPEGMLRAAVHFLQILPGFPLTISRINALTNKAKYDSSRIMSELNYKYPDTLGNKITELARLGSRKNT